MAYEALRLSISAAELERLSGALKTAEHECEENNNPFSATLYQGAWAAIRALLNVNTPTPDTICAEVLLAVGQKEIEQAHE